ncbi:hypothetical protein [Leptotrichia sp. oral taxon 212]|uniref:hypothetical protein n=1 Tax=Leptotrichia sp. oral taxon 212 TaxID=712357 RepID=UPI0006A9F6BF|nr:hypothetical protein [Leptotrichia sp. oral taxon 212]ALA95452.1 hypothetical protein AMK43_04890 [Leptotrichia sp. oral taxon 212]
MKKRILIILGIIMMFIVSCGGKHPAVKDFEDNMKLIQSGDFKKMSKESNKVIAPDTSPEMNEALGEGFKKITYKINKTTVNNDEVLINVTMKSPDLDGFMKELSQKIVGSMAQMQGKTEAQVEAEAEKISAQLIKEKVKSGKTKEKTFDVVYKKKGDKWEPDPNANKDFFNILTMNMGSVD